MSVFWNVADIKNSGKVVFLDAVLHALLEGKKRGVLKKHHGIAAHKAIMEGEFDFSGLSEIIDLIELIRQRPSQGAEAEMFFQMHLNPLHIL